MATVIESNDAFTAFRNDVLVAKFERFRNILLDGLSYHSAVPLYATSSSASRARMASE